MGLKQTYLTPASDKYNWINKIRFAHLILFLILFAFSLSNVLASETAVDEIVVTSTKTDTPILELTGNTVSLPADRIAIIDPQHIYELGTQIAGTWLTRGSGQEIGRAPV